MTSDIRDTLRFLQTENARLTEDNRDLREENDTLRQVINALLALHKIAANVTPQTDVFRLLDNILASALTALTATSGSLLLIDDDTGELVFTVVHGDLRDQLRDYRLPPGTGIAGWVAQNIQPVIIPNARADPRFSPLVDQHFSFQTRTLLCVPIATSRKVLGVITALNKADGKEFTNDDLALLAVVAQLAAIGMEKAEYVSNE